MVPVVVMVRVKVVVWLTSEGLTELVRLRVAGSMTWMWLLTAVGNNGPGGREVGPVAVAVQMPY